MKRLILFFICCLGFANVHAQFCVWADVALAQSITQFHYLYPYSDNINVSYTPRFSINYLKNSDGRLNIGLSAYLENYSISYHPVDGKNGYIVYVGNSGQSYIAEMNDKHTSTYLYLAPILDYTLDEKSEWHLSLSPSLGMPIKGSDKLGSDNSIYSTKGYLNDNIFRMGVQVQKRFEISPGNLLTATLGYSFMSGSLSTALDRYYSDKSINPQIFSIGIGYMRDYKRKIRTSNSPFSISADIGYSVPVITAMSTTSYASNTKTTADNEPYYSVSVLRNKDKQFNYGLTVSIVKNSINLSANHFDFYSGSSSSLSDNHQSTYLYLSPCFDWSIDKNRKWHFSLLPTLGIFMNGMDKGYSSGIVGNNGYSVGAADTNIYQFSGNAYTYKSFNSSEYISKLIFSTALQLKRTILIKGDNSLNLSANYSFMFNQLTSITSQYKHLRPGTFTLGINYSLLEFRKKERNSKPL